MSENPNPPVPDTMDVDDSLGTKLLDREEDVSGSNIFALVIGVDTYEGAKYKKFQLTGAVGDADDFQQYLLEDLRVPKEHITSLRDKGATRTAIIQGFRDLGSDQRIVRGQAIIVIYFAGHGAAADKPKEWLDWESPDDRIEMLCPSDMGLLDGKKGVIEGIPDRTISQLLTVISNAKGNNITLILDCCHSAGINRGGESNDAPNMRSRQVLQPPKVSPDCDSAIWSLAPTTQAVAGFAGTPRDSHVLLAACSRSQTAKEVDGKGLFTRALLKVMRESSMTRGELTYTSLMRCLIIPQQTPHLDGKHIHQKVFALWSNNADSPRIACRYEVGQTFLTLQAGSLLGITCDSIFHIYNTESGSGPYTTAVAKPVGTYISHLIPSTPDFFSQPSQPRVRWYYAQLVTLSGFNFATYCNDPNLLPTVLGDNRGPEFLLAVSTVLNPNDADLCLTVKEEKGHKMVFFDWGNQNRLLSAEKTGLPSRSSRCRYDLSSDGISRIRNIINRYAHFTSHLDTLNLFPLTKFVSIEMKQLDENKQKMTGPDLLNGRDNEPIHITVDMFLLEDKRPCYGFAIHNISEVGLYVYLLYFDPSTLQIDAWYNPKMGPDNMGGQDPQVDPCLSPNAKLHLGLGVAGVRPFRFDVPEDQDVDICFFKFFVSDRPVDLGSIIQSPLSELLAINRGAIQSKNPSPPPPPPILPDSWASRTISVIQKRKSAEQKHVTTRDPYGADISIHTAPSPSPSPLLPSVPVPGPLPGHTSTNHATDSQALARNVPPEPTQVSNVPCKDDRLS
ncbi:caspase domain-containing protein [Armillaria nabsnona]|nr:caspase domain-containing protein [Armillaria nabsnona]